MNVNELFPSNYRRASELSGDTVVTITGIGSQEFNGDPKPVLRLRETKDMILNKTNSKIIAGLYGDEIDNWKGKQITIYVTDVEYRGDMVTGMRIRTAVPTNHNSPLGNGGTEETIGKDDAEELKQLYTEHNWPVDQVKRMLSELCKCDNLIRVPKKNFAALKEYFGGDYKANFDPSTINPITPDFGITDDDIPF